MPFDSADFKECLKETLDYLYDWEKEAREDFNFYALNQWDPEDKGAMEDTTRPALVFDRTRPLIDAVAGTEITSRYEAKFLPRDPDSDEPDQLYSEAASKIFKWVSQRANVEHYISSAFHSCIVSGVGCTETYVDYESDPDGMIVTKRVPIFEMGWDPSSTEPNLADARWLIRDRWLDIDELKSLFGGDVVDEIIARAQTDPKGPGAGGFIGNLSSREVDDGFKAYAEKKGRRYFDHRTKKVRLWECQRFERKYMARILMPPEIEQLRPGVSSEIMVEMQDARDAVEELTAIIKDVNDNLPPSPMGSPTPQIGSPVVIENFPVKKFYRSYYVGDEMVGEDEEIPTKRYSYEFMTCFEDWHEEDRRYFFGLMRPMRDPQKYANKFFSHAVHMWASNPKGLLMYEEDFVEDDQDLATEWAKANGQIRVNTGALSQSAKPKFEVVDSKVNFRGIETLLQHALSSVHGSSGVNPSYFAGGAGDLRRTAASSIESIREQNLATVSIPFDSLRFFKKRHALLVMANVAEHMQPDVIGNVLNNDEMMVAEILSSEDLPNQYDIIVEEVPASQSRQMEVFEKIMQTSFVPQLLELGVGVPPTVAKFFPVPSDVKQEFEGLLQQANELIQQKMENERVGLEVQRLQLELQKMQMAQMASQGVVPQQQPTGQQEQPPGGSEEPS